MATPNSNSVSARFFDAASTGAAKYLLSGSKWGGALGSGVTLTYSYYEGNPSDPTYLDGYWSNSYPGFIDTSRADSLNGGAASADPWIREWNNEALKAWSKSANVTFKKVVDTPSRVGELRFSEINNLRDASGTHVDGLAFFPNNSPNAGDIWYDEHLFIDTATGLYVPHDRSLMKGSEVYFVMLHEIGHALGLKHPHEGTRMPSQYDSIMHTVMSYNKNLPGVTGSLLQFFPTTPMYFDLLSIKELYGARKVNKGNTTYSYDEGKKYFETIDDSGGYDKIVYNGSKFAWIRLTPGEFSTLSENIAGAGEMRNSVTIGPGVVIEAAVGGSANDRLDGNSADNTLNGRGGDDIMQGGSGNDIYIVNSAGDQTIELARGGTDTVRSSIDWKLGANIENLELLGTTAIHGSGNGAANKITGNAANNVLRGGSGQDTLEGGVGADRLAGGSGTDTASYADASKGVTASLQRPSSNTGEAKGDTYSSIERLTGSDHSDRLEGNALANRLSGKDGNDVLIGGAGADQLRGGSGRDTASYEGAQKGVVASLANRSSNTGDAKGDTYSSIESLRGSSFADRLEGNSGANTLSGGAGNDRLTGGSGADKLYGGSGADRFIFKKVSDSTANNPDTIYDFSRGAGDRIDLSRIDARSNSSGDQAFTFIGEKAFSGKAGELRYVNQKGDTYLRGDVDGDRKTEFSLRLDATIDFTKSDFIL
ncbi:M10 family metallopeptidase C-terminal domain-containing protein (plasmid) [Rhizobium sp. TRM96647]|uniref:M10 family metallopeptidase C-terminal domain-containing protein n=1 Tax=unclassified Rhizobium TaxID=2613769 RepID=UPI0021E93279|nr:MULTISPECIES: M10 family metallopeptidase C-terminal domain-containing protein [unclassified Rhizobium]MCV3735652.1 M10 family metallopeptidase C-terminal domain-containing protein [Rhizobium sp. TRM96647]MCV3757585.1 M10 family metallopeptidase C-terminal domain-containing protein [Rhizobium sp. TRM96650]